MRRVTAAGSIAALVLLAAPPCTAGAGPPASRAAVARGAAPAITAAGATSPDADVSARGRPVAFLAADGPDVRAGYIAARLRHDPVYVTDEAPRLLGPSTAARITADVARLGEPAYVVVALEMPGEDPDTLLPLLHDRLGKDGLYLFVDPRGEGTAVRQYGPAPRAYGGGLPLEEIVLTAEEELPYDRNAEQLVRRFVDLALSPDARREYAHPHRPPEPRVTDPAGDESATELALFLAGSGLSGLPLFALLIRRRTRRRRAALIRPGGAPAAAGARSAGRRPGKQGRP